jgi:homoserine O-acetyltransferase
MIRSWQACDLAANEKFGGDFEMAMRAVAARTVLMPGRTDLYFPPEDSEAEVGLLCDARLEVIPSDWGHYAGGGRDPADTAFIDRQLATLLAD